MTADASGTYAFTGLANGSYTVTPSKAGYTFDPASAPVTVSGANVSGIDFTAAAPPTYSISGTISPAAAGAGATVTLSGAAGQTVMTDASGVYTIAGLVPGSYTVTPTKVGYTFGPASAPVTVSGANVSGIDFTAAPVFTYSISGTLSPVAAGAGATVTLSGAVGRTVTADTEGSFTFTGLTNGSYTVTPAKAGYTFDPASAPVTVSGANVGNVDFDATADEPSHTLFTTQTPVVTNETDGPGQDYELGMAFRSVVPGQINAIRFWKAPSESGIHTGRIWSSTGHAARLSRLHRGDRLGLAGAGVGHARPHHRQHHLCGQREHRQHLLRGHL